MNFLIENSVVLSIYKPNLSLLDQMINSLENQTCKSTLFVRCDEELIDQSRYSSLFGKLNLDYDRDVAHYGHARSYSYLLEKVNSPLIHFADQDDYWFPEKTARALEILGSEEAIKLSYCGYEKNILGKRIRRKQIRNSKNSKTTFIFRNKVPGCTMSFTRETNLLYREVVKNFDKIKHHDWLMILIASLYGSVIADNYLGVRYNVHKNNAIGIPSLKKKTQNYLHQMRGHETCPYWVLQGSAILNSIPISNSNTVFLENCIKKHSKSRLNRIRFISMNKPLNSSFVDIFYLVALFVIPKKCSSCGGESRYV